MGVAVYGLETLGRPRRADSARPAVLGRQRAGGPDGDDE
jgi:hypothetical protein